MYSLLKRFLYQSLKIIFLLLGMIVVLFAYDQIRHHFYDKPIIKFCEELELGLSYDEAVFRANKLGVGSLSQAFKHKGKLSLHGTRLLQGGFCSMSFEQNKLVSAQYNWPH